MLLSEKILDAQKRHADEYPDGDWRSVNDELDRLSCLAFPILSAAGINPLLGGNKGRAQAIARLECLMQAKLLPTFWIMRTADGFHMIQPSDRCRPEDQAAQDDDIMSIEDEDGNVIWQRKTAASESDAESE